MRLYVDVSHACDVAGAAAGAAAFAVLCACMPFMLVSMLLCNTKCFRKKNLWRSCRVILNYTFFGVAALPTAALVIGLFPLSLPLYFILHDDDD
jgi:hypothetical protein